MALCAICRTPLPDATLPRCPSCGASLDPEQGGVAPPLDEPSAAGDAAQEPPPEPSAQEPPPEPTPPPFSSTPWDERERLGVVTALVETTRQVLTAPIAFFGRTSTGAGLGGPALYALVVGWLGLIVHTFYDALYRSLVGPRALPFTPEQAELGAMVGWTQGWVGLVVQLVFGWAFVLIGLTMWAGVLHLLLLLLGGARRGFEATLRVVAYSHAASVVLVVPFCGQVAVLGWMLVLFVVGLAAVHGIGYAKATAAVLSPVLLVCCCFVGLIGALVGSPGGLPRT